MQVIKSIKMDLYIEIYECI